MKIQSIKTSFVEPNEDLFEHFIKNVKVLNEKSIVVISSKVFSYAENRILQIKNASMLKTAIKKEADKYFEGKVVDLTYKNGLYVANAGIDKSNAPKGSVVLWPKNCQQSVDDFLDKLKKYYKITQAGVLMIDSICQPGRSGVVGGCIAYSGIIGVKDERGKKDIFGRKLKLTKVNIADSLASVSNMLMGEADELTPYCIITECDVDFTAKKVDSIKLLSMPLNECMFSI